MDGESGTNALGFCGTAHPVCVRHRTVYAKTFYIDALCISSTIDVILSFETVIYKTFVVFVGCNYHIIFTRTRYNAGECLVIHEERESEETTIYIALILHVQVSSPAVKCVARGHAIPSLSPTST